MPGAPSANEQTTRRGLSNQGMGRIPVEMRHLRIMEAFQQNGFISVTEMAAKIGVSTMTIRRDLDQLELAGKISRTHGGAVALRDGERIGGEDEESLFSRRLDKNADAKNLIARIVAGLIPTAQAVGLDTGTTVLTAAQHLVERKDLRFVTNNVRAALALAEGESGVYLLAGELRTPELSIVGSSAVKTLQSHFLDIVLLGISAIDESGIYDFSPEDTEVKCAFIESATRVVALCDSSKFGRRSLARIDKLDVIDVLVTDQAPPPELAAALKNAQVEVLVAGDSEVGMQ